MFTRLWRVTLVATLAVSAFGAVNTAPAAVAAPEATVATSVRVSLTVTVGAKATLCASGKSGHRTCVTVTTGPSTVTGSLTATVSASGATPILAVSSCGTDGTGVTVTSDVSDGGGVSARFRGTVAPPGSTVDRTVSATVTGPDTVEASLCVA